MSFSYNKNLLFLCDKDGPQFYSDYIANINAVKGLHLQWFAAPDDEGRTEKPTERKIRKAKEEGKVAKSTDLASSIVLLVSIVVIGLLSKYLLIEIGNVMISYFTTASSERIYEKSGWILSVVFSIGKIVLPVLMIGFIFAILANVVQFGFLFSAKPIIPDFKKIIPNFANYFKKAFASVEAFYNLTKSVVKVLVVAAVAYLNISAKIDYIDYTIHLSLWDSFVFYANLIFTIMVESALVFILLAVPDYLFQRKQHLDSLKMTKYDLKQEFKETEGDPLIKSRMRERMNQLLKSSMLKEVAKADVVITNPTHFAVALAYDRSKAIAPYVVAKGEDNMALQIRRIATQNDVYISENKELARALYKELEVGDVIPEHYYEVIVTILTKVYQMNGKLQEAI